jgi:hypothetical protein
MNVNKSLLDTIIMDKNQKEQPFVHYIDPRPFDQIEHFHHELFEVKLEGYIPSFNLCFGKNTNIVTKFQ